MNSCAYKTGQNGYAFVFSKKMSFLRHLCKKLKRKYEYI